MVAARPPLIMRPLGRRHSQAVVLIVVQEQLLADPCVLSVQPFLVVLLARALDRAARTRLGVYCAPAWCCRCRSTAVVRTHAFWHDGGLVDLHTALDDSLRRGERLVDLVRSDDRGGCIAGGHAAAACWCGGTAHWGAYASQVDSTRKVRYR